MARASVRHSRARFRYRFGRHAASQNPNNRLLPLFALITGATDSKLAQMVEYLKAENAVLRAKLPTRIT